MTDCNSNNRSNIEQSDPRHYSFGTWVVVAVLSALLVASGVISYVGWTSTNISVPTSGYVALTLGVVFSLLVGGGLMALVFFSSRKVVRRTGGAHSGGRPRSGRESKTPATERPMIRLVLAANPSERPETPAIRFHNQPRSTSAIATPKRASAQARGSPWTHRSGGTTNARANPEDSAANTSTSRPTAGQRGRAASSLSRYSRGRAGAARLHDLRRPRSNSLVQERSRRSAHFPDYRPRRAATA
jgi:hypothetical protein